MKPPLFYRKEIPFYHHKTNLEYQKDVYERYDEMVVRQSALHLADDLWGRYPMQNILDFAQPHYPNDSLQHILEIGSGVGRWIATLAQKYPKSNCWGIDYSYQMSKRAQEYWIQGKELTIDLSNKGFNALKVQTQPLKNIHFGVAKASNLPFFDNSQDLVINSFLLDRLDDPLEGLKEMHRVLKPNGKLILITPLNFAKATHWEIYYPPSKLYQVLMQMGFQISHWQEDIIIQEPLDAHGNVVRWRCLGGVACKIS